jgi:hypothetical protein
MQEKQANTPYLLRKRKMCLKQDCTVNAINF